jgi:hypothetical protein
MRSSSSTVHPEPPPRHRHAPKIAATGKLGIRTASAARHTPAPPLPNHRHWKREAGDGRSPVATTPKASRSDFGSDAGAAGVGGGRCGRIRAATDPGPEGRAGGSGYRRLRRRRPGANSGGYGSRDSKSDLVRDAGRGWWRIWVVTALGPVHRTSFGTPAEAGGGFGWLRLQGQYIGPRSGRRRRLGADLGGYGSRASRSDLVRDAGGGWCGRFPLAMALGLSGRTWGFGCLGRRRRRRRSRLARLGRRRGWVGRRRRLGSPCR